MEAITNIIRESGRTIYGLSLLIQDQTGEDVNEIQSRLSKWVSTGIPPQDEIADRDLRILGYTIEIHKI